MMSDVRAFSQVFLLPLGLLAAAAIFVLPPILARGYQDWESRGDAKFYADCAARFRATGRFTWNEIYPVALRRGAGTRMAFTAVAHPLAIAAVMQVSGQPAEASAVMASALAWLALLLGLFAAGAAAGGPFLGVFACAAGVISDSTRASAACGGTESLSQAFMAWSLALLLLYLRRPNRAGLATLIIVSWLGCFVRPHNLFWGMALVSLFFVKASSNRERIRVGRVGLEAFAAYIVICRLIALGSDLRFPYLFSFLVNTPRHPGHEIFRLYFPGGFRLETLWAERRQLLEKIPVGLAVLKQYWTGWLPHAAGLAFALISSKSRAVPALVLSVLMLSLLSSGLGHLVPRYWEIMEPLAIIALLASAAPLFARRTSVWRATVLAALAVLVVSKIPRAGEIGKLHRDLVPATLVAALPEGEWLACDKPAQAIGALHRPLLLLPENPELLVRISAEVQPVRALLFTPDLRDGELAAWAGHAPRLQALGYRVLEDEGWTLYLLR